MLLYSVAQIGFTSSPFLFSENRPATNIGVVLSNDIVDGRSVTVSVVEEGNVKTLVFCLYT